MPDAIAFFSIRLIAGIAFVALALTPSRLRVVPPYFRILLLLLLGLGVLFGLAAPPAAAWAISIGVAAFVGSVCWLIERRGVGIACLFVILLASTVWIARIPAAGDAAGSLFLLSASASAATLGTAMAGMLLGHRYLTAPGMPLDPLYWANTLLGASGLLRLAISAWGLVAAGGAPHDTTSLTWLALRWLAGIAGPLAVWFMVRRILAYRNTQSATGVLFVGVILTFIGELTADVLYRTSGFLF